MRKVKILFLLIGFLFVFHQCPVTASNYKEVANSQKGIWFIDLDSIRYVRNEYGDTPIKHLIEYWGKVELVDEDKEEWITFAKNSGTYNYKWDSVSYILFKNRINIKNRERATCYLVIYNEFNTPLYSTDFPIEYKPIIPDSITDSFLKMVELALNMAIVR